MSPLDDLRRVKEIFLRALELTHVDRDAYLLDACGSDRATRARVERLLTADRHAEGFLSEPRRGPGRS